MELEEVKRRIELLAQQDPRYRVGAYCFVSDALNFTLKRVMKRRHISALELLEGLRDYGNEKYGILAKQVMQEWGIITAKDVGNIVFGMIESGLFSASKNDSIEEYNIDFPLVKENFTSSGVPLTALPKID